MEETTSKARGILSKDLLDVLFKFPLGVVGFFYVSGIFVQGLYFGRLGINTLNLFKLSYILAGFWAVFIIILPAFLIVFAAVIFFRPQILRLQYKANYPFAMDIIVRIAVLLVIAGIYSVVVHSIFPFLVKMYSDLFQILWLAVVFSSVVSLTFFSLKIILPGKGKIEQKVLLALFYSLVIICVYIGCLDSFSKTIYLNIPAHLGGGNPISVNLIFKASEKEISLLEKEMSMSFGRDSENNQDKKSDDTDVYSATVLLITETDDGFYFKTEDNKVVFLKRDSILHLTFSGTVF